MQLNLGIKMTDFYLIAKLSLVTPARKFGTLPARFVS